MPRLSLTSRQIETPAGSELLNICRAITDDGHISDDELAKLREWLVTNRHSELPASEYLLSFADAVLADGQVTDTERKELFRVVEAVLPPQHRAMAKMKRRDLEEAEREERKAQREAERAERRAEREAYREERARNRPVYSANFMVAGAFAEDRPSLVRRFVRENEPAFLRREPNNRFSRNAIEVRTSTGHVVGYVPEEVAEEMAPLLDDETRYSAEFVKVLTGGRNPIPVVEASLYGEGATIPDLCYATAHGGGKGHGDDRRGGAYDAGILGALIIGVLLLLSGNPVLGFLAFGICGFMAWKKKRRMATEK
jgi:hypothetical protein